MRETERIRARKRIKNENKNQKKKTNQQTPPFASKLALFFKSILFVFLKYNANVEAKDKE